MGFAMDNGARAPYRLTAVLESSEGSWCASDHDVRLHRTTRVEAICQDMKRLLWLFEDTTPFEMTVSVFRRGTVASTLLSITASAPFEMETEAAVGVLLAHYGITLWGTTGEQVTTLSSLKVDGHLKNVDRLTQGTATLTFKSVVAEVTGVEASDLELTHYEVEAPYKDVSTFAYTVLRQAERQCFQAGVFRFSA